MKHMMTAALALAMAGTAVAQDTRKAMVTGKLENSRITLDFKEAPLDDVLNFLREFTGIDFVLDAGVRDKLSDEQLKITFKAKDLTLKAALKLILTPRELTAVYRDGVLVVEHKDKTARAATMELYDVRDLLLKIQDFPGPIVELAGPGKSGGTFEFTVDEGKSVIEEGFLEELVKANTGDRSWDENPAASLSLANGRLIVTQSKKVHEEIRRLLNLLRQYK